jgi:hypothetical protein
LRKHGREPNGILSKDKVGLTFFGAGIGRERMMAGRDRPSWNNNQEVRWLDERKN